MKRIWIGARVKQIDFSADGAQCLVLGDDKTLRVFDPSDWSAQKILDDMAPLAIAGNSPVAVTCGRRTGGGPRDMALVVWSLPDWKVVKRIALPEGVSPGQVAITADGGTAYLRTGTIQDPEETKVDPGPQPKSSLEQGIWRARNDGRVTDLLVVDLEQGRVKSTVRCFDSDSNCRLYAVENGAAVVAYNRYYGFLDATKGTYEVTPTGEFAYGSGMGPTGEIYTGSLRSFIALEPDGKTIAKGRISQLPGFPEYFRAFAPMGPDRVVAVTDAFRAIVIDAGTRAVVKETAGY